MEGGKHEENNKARLNIKETQNLQLQEMKLKIRKQRINTYLMRKRLVEPIKEDDIDLEDEHLEVKEVKEQRRTEDQRLPDLTKHHRKKPKRHSKKRCWVCKSFGHFKKQCPFIRCFHCGRTGHMKANCFIKKIDTLLKKTAEEKEKINKKKQRKKKRKEEKKRRTAIYKLRLNQSKFVEEKNKNYLYWKNEPIGVYMSHHSPPKLELLRQKPINWKKIDADVRKETPIIKLALLDNFINYCGCGKFGLTKYEFIKHVYDKHNGETPPDSQINKPSWIDNVAFFNDELEILYCQTLEDLPEE